MSFKPTENSCLYKPVVLTILLTLVTSIFVYAQKEAAVWPIGSGYQFNFQSGDIDISTFSGNENATATICDKDGNLVLYSDGRTVWNRNNEILSNGEGLIKPESYIQNPPIFVPYPKREGWYILFYEENGNEIQAGHINNSLYFAEINTNANGGQGEVVRKNIKLHNDYHSAPTIAGYCNNSFFWLAIDRNDNVESPFRDRIYFYKIDENGVTLTPKINDEIDIGNSSGYKFSPNGQRLHFRFGGNSIEADVIADFNFLTGDLIKKYFLYLNINYETEFSSNSRFFYYFSGASLIQIDVGYSDPNLIMHSADTLLTLATNDEMIFPFYDLQIAPDGKIYFTYFDINDLKMKLGRINEPNNKGDACEVESSLYTFNFNIFRFPEFVTSFFKDPNQTTPEEVFPDAGPELTLCSKTSAIIGTPGNPDVNYSWIPATNLVDPFSAQTSITAPINNTSPQVITYLVRATDGNCWFNYDSTTVTILPTPKDLPVDGSRSVCPFVEEVDYWTIDDQNSLHWLVNGGVIVTNAANDSIKINWWDTNPIASASVFSTNSYQCNSDTTVFPVRINVALITEKPKGPDKLCIADSKNIIYTIQNTNGSVYTWMANEGEIISGQGTNQVVVDWKKAGLHQILVQETSVTTDTICFGESEPLAVEIVNDSLQIYLSQVSFNSSNNVVVNYSSAKLQNLIHLLFLLIENKDGNGFQEQAIPIQVNGEYTYFPNTADLSPDKMQLKVINSCNEVFYSNQQQTIVLHGNEILSQDIIRLNWNINQFWENDRLKTEIWHSANGKDGWELISDDETGIEYNFPFQGLSLTHYFKVKEINEDKNAESWSNTINIVIDDELTIPEVFTPNADGINDDWQIENINFHPVKSIVVYNKLGEVVFESKNEYAPWDGEINGEILQGTYFYQITFTSEDTRYGQVTILR